MSSENRKTIYFINCGGPNAGDLYSSPKLYYEFTGFETKQITFEQVHNIKNSIVIFGGGGILDTSIMRNKYYKNLDSTNIYFQWGSGSNSLNVSEVTWKIGKGEVSFEKDTLENFLLVGRRDYGQKYLPNHIYVPCSSCKLEPLRKTYNIVRRIGIVQHMWLQQIKGLDFPKIDMKLNRKNSIEDIVKFIGESEVIITGSFHGAYFGLLLRKKVIINGSWSSKFDTLKYKPVKLTDNLEDDISKCIVPPEGYLEECIRLNNDFYTRVMLEIKSHT